MQTEREYLYSIGLTKAPTGRGRFSGAAHEALAKARAEGVQFKEKVAPQTKTIVKSKAKAVVSSTSVENLGDAYLRYGKYDMSFEGFDDNGKRHVVSGRNACSCGYSLVGHTCDNPTALVAGGTRIGVRPIV